MRIPKTLTLVFVMTIILISSVSGGLFASGPSDSADPVTLPRPVGSEGQAGAPAGALSTPQLIEAARAKGQIDRETANLYLAYALADPERLPAEYQGKVPWDGTLPLLRLQESVHRMAAGVERSAIESLLAGVCGGSSGTLDYETESTHFYVEHDPIEAGLSISDYTTSLETTWSTEVDSFGWAAPPTLAPGDRYHVRIDDLGSGLYGYVTTSGTYAGWIGNNPATDWDDVDAYATCMVLNVDYGYPFPGTPEGALQATAAHEFNHSIQFGYGALTGANAPDPNLVEGGATWMEDEVFDSANDNYNYLWPQFHWCMGEYTDDPNQSYPYWITLRGLTERYGTGTAGAGEQVMQDFWEETSQSTTSNMLTALNTALVNKGTTLADAYHAYAIAVKFNKPCDGGYVYPYCFEEGAGYVSAAGPTAVHGSIASVGGSYSSSVEDNYTLNWISLPTSGGPYTVTLQNTSDGGQLRFSAVCDTGSALVIRSLPAPVGADALTSLADYDPSGCNSVVAVITNQAQTSANPASCTARSFTLTTAESSPAELEPVAFLPIVMKRWPPIPDVPVLNAISNSDHDGDYGVDWDSAYLASTYELQEDDNSSFSSPVTRYSGSLTYYSVNDKPVGTWYYRVRGCNSYGCSGWSVTRSVAVLPPQCVLYVDNDTGGTLNYEVEGTGIGQKSFSGGEYYYGSFPAGTYTYSAKAWCGSIRQTKYFPAGTYVDGFECAPAAMLDSLGGLLRLKE
jgi:hypothetical protein